MWRTSQCLGSLSTHVCKQPFASWFSFLVCNFAVSAIWSPHAFLFSQWGIVQRTMPVSSRVSSRNCAGYFGEQTMAFSTRVQVFDSWPGVLPTLQCGRWVLREPWGASLSWSAASCGTTGPFSWKQRQMLWVTENPSPCSPQDTVNHLSGVLSFLYKWEQ